MEELLGLIIFGVIAAISGLAKLIEKRKEEEQRSQRGPRKSVDELPEATRRMLYGDGAPPVARKRGEGPSSAPPRQATPAAPAPQRRPVPTPTQRQSTPDRPATPPRRQAPTPPPVPQRRPVPAQPLQQRQSTRPRPVAQPRRSAPQRPAHQTLRENWQQAQRPSEPHRTADTTPQQDTRDSSRRRTRQRRRSSIKALLHHPKTLKTSIILQEVLSAPKSLR